MLNIDDLSNVLAPLTLEIVEKQIQLLRDDRTGLGRVFF